jgi:hypothetical protein
MAQPIVVAVATAESCTADGPVKIHAEADTVKGMGCQAQVGLPGVGTESAGELAQGPDHPEFTGKLRAGRDNS